MLGELVKAVLERALESEMAAHLGHGKSERDGGSDPALPRALSHVRGLPGVCGIGKRKHHIRKAKPCL
jgi:hypothetical protein